MVSGKPEKTTNESLGLVGGRGGLRGGWKARKANQRVTETRWWQRWAAWWVESQKRPPTSHRDSLVAEVGHVVGGKPEKPTNESLGLVGGGGGGPCGEWKARKGHQRVTGTCWWQRWAVWWVESQKNQPTSHRDSLVVVVGWWCKCHAQMCGCGDGCVLVVVVSSHHRQYLDILLEKNRKKRNKKIKTYLSPRDVNV